MPPWLIHVAKYYGPVGILCAFAIVWGNNIDEERKAQAERSYLDQKAFTTEILRVTTEQTRVTGSTAEAIRQFAERLELQTEVIEAQGRILEGVAREMERK